MGGMDAPSSPGDAAALPCLEDFWDEAAALPLEADAGAEAPGLVADGVAEAPLRTSPGLTTPSPGFPVEAGVGACLWLLSAGAAWWALGVCERRASGKRDGSARQPCA